jgi:hypothetical protein
MLFARRRRLEALTKAEAEGQSFWSTEFDKNARMKFVHAFQDACSEDMREKYAEVARGLILRDEGLPYLTDPYKNHQTDLLNFLLNGKDDMLPSAIEAIARVLTIPTHEMGGSFSYSPRVDPEYFTDAANVVLREHRISFELIEGQMVPLKSQELHAAIVAPMLRLLSGRAGLGKVEAAYQDALGELAEGKPADAITDAATALQEALVARGCKGNALGPLAKSARSKGLFGPHDAVMTDMLHRMVDWVSADRSAKGDAHQVAQPSVEDAWLTVHVVGALILRLAGPRR